MKHASILSTLLWLSLRSVWAVADDDDAQNKSAPATASSSLNLEPPSLQRAGIVTQTTQLTTRQTEIVAYGQVLNSEPLLALRNRYLMAQAQHLAKGVLVAQLAKTAQRQAQLYTQGISSQRALQERQAQFQEQQVLLGGEALQVQAIEQEALLVWGSVVTAWLTSPHSKPLQDLLTGEAHLLQINLPSHAPLNGQQRIAVAASSERAHALPAQFIAISPQNLNGQQGTGYFLLVKSRALQAGMAVTAWLGNPQLLQTGVMIPSSALVWSAGQALVYIQSGNTFTGRVIGHYTPTTEGYFISQDVQGGEQLVVTGAQQLLSEQLRKQIPDDDDD